MRTGDNLLVTITNASDSGRHAWKMIGGAPQLKLLSQKYSGGKQTLTFAGAAAGTTTLVIVTPTGDPPLQTFALPVALKTPAAP